VLSGAVLRDEGNINSKNFIIKDPLLCRQLPKSQPFSYKLIYLTELCTSDLDLSEEGDHEHLWAKPSMHFLGE
jgi:hypothetical protein